MNIMVKCKWACVLLVLALLGVVPGVARGDVIAGTVAGQVGGGELAGRLGVGADGRMGMSMGFRWSNPNQKCCDNPIVLNLVVADDNPPKWQDDGRPPDIHIIPPVTGPAGLYVDPVRGGPLGPGGVQQPGVDNEPGYDGIHRNTKASQAGNGVPEYGLNNVNQNGVNWTADPVLDLVASDNPSKIPVGAQLKFVTLVCCIEGKEICPIAGFSWGQNADGTRYITGPFAGNNYPGGMTTQNITDGLARSGFGGYTMKNTCDCPAPVSAGLLALSVPVAFRRRRA